MPIKVFIAATKNAPDPQAGSSKVRVGKISFSRRSHWTISKLARIDERPSPHLGEGSKSFSPRSRRRGGKTLQHQFVNRTIAQVFGNFWTSIIGTKFFLVNVFLKNVAQYIRVDFQRIFVRAIVQVPRITREQFKHLNKGAIANLNIRILLLDWMPKE